MRPNWFVALPVPAGAWFQERVAPHPPACVRLFHPADLHLTVAFLGGVEEAAARRAWELHARWTQGGLRATLGEVIGMGPPQHFSALSALLEDGRAAVEDGMRACRDAMLAAAGAAPELRPIKAHVTLARPTRSARAQERGAALAWALQLPVRGVAVTLSEMALYTRAEDQRDRQFRIVERRALAGAAAGDSGHRLADA